MSEFVERLQTAVAGKYAIDREIGRGGMALVYLARDLRHDREVALKVLRPELSATLGAERFLREIQIAAKLAHPHVLPLYDSGEAQSLLYFVMPYVGGATLRHRLDRDGQLPLDDVLRIVRAVADALGYAHERGIVHRDIKPENILFEAGHPVVSDFGIARAVTASEQDAITGAGLAIGTPAYMSPEQAGGEDEIDSRSDVYALACVAYEMITGSPPFTGSKAEAIIHRQRFEDPPPASASRNTAPDAVDTVLRRALAKEPADRFPNAPAFAEALAQALDGVSVLGVFREKSVAVLPFSNMSADPDNEYFSDGMTEEIIAALAGLPDLRVASRTSSFAFKGKLLNVREVGRKLHVATVLEGSVRKAGSRLRITAQLVNVDDGYQLWSERYDRELDDVFEVQEEIALAIAGRLKAELLEEREAPLVRKATSNVEAYTLFLKGRYHWNKRTEAAVQRGIECFEQALALDPEFALASAGLADSYNIIGFYDMRRPHDVFPKAKAAALRAFELAPHLAEACASLAYARLYYDWDFAGAEADLRCAIEYDPSYAMAHHYLGNYYVVVGKVKEAKRAFLTAERLEPLSLIISAGCGWALYYAREYREAVRQFDATLEMDEAFGLAHLWRGLSLTQLGAYDTALPAYQQAYRCLDGAPMARAAAGYACALDGNRDEAEHILAELETGMANRYVSPYHTAGIRAALGDLDGTFERLDRAFEERSHSLVFLQMDPMLDGIRADPRFTELVARVGIPGGGVAGG